MGQSIYPIASSGAVTAPGILPTNIPSTMSLRSTISASGTWTNPGVSLVYVVCVGGGGGGGGNGCGGGAGAVYRGLLPVSGNQNVVIGTGGIGNNTSGTAYYGDFGGATMFGNPSTGMLIAPGGVNSGSP